MTGIHCCLDQDPLKRHWTLLVISQNTCWHKTILGNKQWRAIDSITHCEKRLPLKLRSFWEEVISHLSIWIELEISAEVANSRHLKAYNFCDTILSQLRWPFESNFSQVCYFVHMLRYTKWEDWSLTITNSVQCLWSYPYYPDWNNILLSQSGPLLSQIRMVLVCPHRVTSCYASCSFEKSNPERQLNPVQIFPFKTRSDCECVDLHERTLMCFP